MSGMKRRVQPTGSNLSVTQSQQVHPPQPAVQMYNPNQYSNLQSQWQHQELQTPNENHWYNNQTLTQPQQQYNQPSYMQQQPHQQVNYWQQPYANSANATPSNNQQFIPHVQGQDYYNNQHNYEVSTNHIQEAQVPQQTASDPWNWSWAEEDNSNIQNIQPSNTSAQSLGSENPWNSPKDANINSKGVQNIENINPVFPKISKLKEKSQSSMDSQFSQDSSDPLHTSESDKSQMLSRSSTVSESPVSGFNNYMPQDDTNSPGYVNNSQQENHEVLSNYQHLLSAGRNQTPPLVSSPSVKTHSPPILSPAAGADVGNTFKRNRVLPEQAKPDFYSNPSIKTHSPPMLSLAAGADVGNTFKRNRVPPEQAKPDFYSNNFVNLETMPENSEHPDLVPYMGHVNKISPVYVKPENNEIAPINDRNQYLETGQLESLPVDINNRLVVGQQLQQDDPLPPGLSRMVLGQTESIEPPVGLHRMIPGESSSPETYQAADILVRSATIGADMSSPAIGNLSGVYNVRETNADGANNFDDESSLDSIGNRHDLIDGQPQTDTITKLTSSVRDLTIGENATDAVPSSIASDRINRGSSRQDSSDSGPEEKRENITKEKKNPRYEHDDQYERHKNRNMYSPSSEKYRDKKHEKRRNKSRKYDDDTDYFSDKEKDRRRDDRGDRRHEDYGRKYNSLKREEKDRKRRDHRSREYGRDGHRNDYYNRYDDDYEDLHRSRPTSRSDSMHESYRQDHDHRYRDRHRRHREREPFNQYMQGYPYDPYNPYYQQYQYYENLRRTNPQAYAEWYRKYYQQANIGQQNYGNDDRASVHSGRSSANDELIKERYLHQSYYNQSAFSYYREPQAHSISGHYGLDQSRPFDQTDSSLYLEETTAASQRCTPAKFATPHVKASLSSGRLVKVFPHYPLDGQAANVEISNLHEILAHDDGYRGLAEYPGPLLKGITHKKTIIEFCENKIRNATCNKEMSDIDSYVLMWELLILLLRQNGMVVGTDIAELLMKDRKHQQQSSRRASFGSHSSSLAGENLVSEMHASENSNSLTSVLKEDAVTNKFRNYLIYGSEKEALEWAMKHGLWGHALFLASKLDKRTYASVMTRFANGLNMNDPLQTLYQLLSGKVPSAVTCVVDEKWGDWRPHLAMILSNTTQRPELDQKAITTLGDTLLNRGSLFAAQFCYLMVQIGFSRYGNPDAKLVLLGSNHNKPFLEFATNEAILMTEIYEYACSLNNETFLIPEFLPYKYLLATRLADYGLLEKSLAYLEKIASAVIQNPTTAQASLVSQTCELADHLQYYDSLEDHETNWLEELKAVERDFNLGLIKHESVENFLHDNLEQDLTSATHHEYEPLDNQEPWQPQYQQVWQPQSYPEQQQPPIEYGQAYNNLQSEAPGVEAETPQTQQEHWPYQQQWNKDYAGNQQDNTVEHTQNDYWNVAKSQEMTSHPQISMPNQRKSVPIADEGHKLMQEKSIKDKVQPVKPNSNSGWFGGIFSKLSLRPKNQMKLPDDKNPTIVWDEAKKKWINKDADGEDGAAEFKPPPKITDIHPNKALPISDMMHGHAQHNNNNNIQQSGNINSMNLYNNTLTSQRNTSESTVNQQISNQPNMFKLQRDRNIKKSYIDVFNPGTKATTGNAGTMPPPPQNTYTGVQENFNYFMPVPINDPHAPTDFLTPARTEENSQMSRWSSASSLSKEVQHYTQRKRPILHH